MLIMPQTIEMTWVNSNKRYYEEKGYIWTKNNVIFNVNIEDLPEKCGKKVKVLCDYCEKEFSQPFSEIVDVKNICCKNCRNIKGGKARVKYTIEKISQIFIERGFTLLSLKYEGYAKHLDYICDNNHKCTITLKNFLKGRGCKKCAMKTRHDKNRTSIDEVREIFAKEGCVLISETYKNNDTKLKYICSCGNSDDKTLSKFKSGQRCKQCGSQKLRKANLKYSYDNFDDLIAFYEINGCVLLENEYIGCTTHMKFICTCGSVGKTSLTGFQNGVRCNNCLYLKRSGTNHFNFKLELTQEEREYKRNIVGYGDWRKNVYKRDNYTCQCCGYNKGGKLNAHHLNGYNWCDDLRTEVFNGITLCENCHVLNNNSFHKVCGSGGNTIYQFISWFRTVTNSEFNMELLGESYETLFYFCKRKGEDDC